MERYRCHDVKQRGSVERASYMTRNAKGEPVAKYANVYLPYGYTPAKKYNVLYLMHGGGGNPDAWFDCCYLKNMLDAAFSEGVAEPCIVVTPSYYTEGTDMSSGVDGRMQTRVFQAELAEDVIPAIESRYSTYAENITAEGLHASRMHRAFGGFSMGSCTTWFAFLLNLDYIAYFLPLSGGCWEVKQMGGRECPEDTAKVLADHVIKSGYTTEEFFIYPSTGTEDMAMAELNPQVEAMRAYPEIFVETDTNPNGNFHYTLVEGENHSYDSVYNYVYWTLPKLFKK